MKRKIIFSCDDLGINKKTNDTILKCLKFGIASSTSLLVNTPAFRHALNNVVPIFKNKIGLHLNLTIGKPVLKNNYLPDLINNKGFFKKKSFFFYMLNFYKKKNYLRQIYRELDAQIKKAKKNKILISHIDSQEHVHMSPVIFSIFIRLMRKHKINKIRYVNEKIFLNDFYKNFFFKIYNFNYLKSIIIKICMLFNKGKFKSSQKFYSIINIGIVTKENIIKIISNNNLNNKITEISLHPGEIINDKFYKKYNNNTYMFLKSPNRILEKETLLNKELKNMLYVKRYKTISFSEI